MERLIYMERRIDGKWKDEQKERLRDGNMDIYEKLKDGQMERRIVRKWEE